MKEFHKIKPLGGAFCEADTRHRNRGFQTVADFTGDRRCHLIINRNTVHLVSIKQRVQLSLDRSCNLLALKLRIFEEPDSATSRKAYPQRMSLLVIFSDNLAKGRRIGKLSKSSCPLHLVHPSIIEGRVHTRWVLSCFGYGSQRFDSDTERV